MIGKMQNITFQFNNEDNDNFQKAQHSLIIEGGAIGMGWDKLLGTGVSTAQEIAQRPTAFLTRH